MNFSKNLHERIDFYIENDLEFKKRILAGDADAIREIGLMSQKGINPDDIIEAYESNNNETMEYLYKNAKRLQGLKELYRDLCFEYYEEIGNKEITR